MDKNKITVIAEMACSHDGSPELARQIIDGAGQARADAVQLQIWSLANMIAPNHSVYNVCRKIELSQEQWKMLIQYSRKHYPMMEIYAFIYEHTSVEFTENMSVDGYKLSSSDLSNPYVLSAAARTGKKINLSVGASTLEEIRLAIKQIKKISRSQITLMYGYQNFPTTIKDVNLNYMVKLKEMLKMPVGYQDHCDAQCPSAFWIPALAAGMGASVLEKHLTHDRSLKGVDHESALNPDEFKNFATMVRELAQARGVSMPKGFSADELKYRKFQKKSIVAARDLKAGMRLKKSDLSFLRAAELGLAPDQTEKIIHKRILRDIPAYHVICEKDLS